ncbi:MAG: hypothetical protein NSGCLCUN01_03929 [uncultured Clostridium sp.]
MLRIFCGVLLMVQYYGILKLWKIIKKQDLEIKLLKGIIERK